MKQKFSKHWEASKQPRKQRKFIANAPLHIKRKFLSVNLSKDLRKKHRQRNVVVVKGDTVKIMRGKFSKKQGKVTEVKIKLQKIYIENIQRKKTDGSKVNIPLRPSNLQIVELNLEDRKRKLKNRTETKSKEKIEKVGKKKEDSKEKTKEDIK